MSHVVKDANNNSLGFRFCLHGTVGNRPLQRHILSPTSHLISISGYFQAYVDTPIAGVPTINFITSIWASVCYSPSLMSTPSHLSWPSPTTIRPLTGHTKTLKRSFLSRSIFSLTSIMSGPSISCGSLWSNGVYLLSSRLQCCYMK